MNKIFLKIKCYMMLFFLTLPINKVVRRSTESLADFKSGSLPNVCNSSRIGQFLYRTMGQFPGKMIRKNVKKSLIQD